MIIEFADPGYNFGYMWWAIGLGVLGVALSLLPFFLTDDPRKISAWPLVGLILFVVGPSLLAGISVEDYQERVELEKETRIQELGISSIELIGDRITGSTEDGKYFSGVLVDLHPDSGYDYQVVELTELGD